MKSDSAPGLSGRVLPLTIFPALTLLSLYLIFGHLSKFDAPLRFEYCSPSSDETSPYALSYTGFKLLDSELCFMVSVFHVALNDAVGYTFLEYFLGTSSIYVILPYLEALRPHSLPSNREEGRLAKSLRWPASWLMATQAATLGVTMTVWGLAVSIVRGSTTLSWSSPSSGSSSGPKDGRKQTQGGGQEDRLSRLPSMHGVLSIIPAVILGAALPSYALLHYKDPKITVLWQIFAIYVLLVGWTYRRIAVLARSPSTTSVKSAVVIVLAASFLTSTYFHLTLIWPLLVSGEGGSLGRLFLPSHSSSTITPSIEESVLAFLQYDFHFAWISAFLVTLFTARFHSIGDLFRIVVIATVGTVVVGPGAMLAGVALWKENKTP